MSAGQVVDRLLASRSQEWLRVVVAAALDRSATEEPDPAPVVRPYAWLIRRTADGVRLTQAGYLPPTVVSEAMTALQWQDRWIGKHNREDRTLPILELRQTAQRWGLVRKDRGRLLATKRGRALAEDPRSLWWYLAERLPAGTSEAEEQAGLLYLLTVAAGAPLDPPLLARGMWILGWVERGSPLPMSPSAAFESARDTWATLERLGLLTRKVRWDAPEPPPTAGGVRLARAALLGQPDTSPAHPAAANPARRPVRGGDTAVQLLVTLRDIDPPIWRRLVVPASLTLAQLHAVLQTAMGWRDSHLHLFDVAGVLYGDTYDIDSAALGEEDAFTVGQAAQQAREFRYEYDFGDSWEHDITVEQSMSSVGRGTPHLIDGARACPPEDCGGPGGYTHLLEALSDPLHEEHDDWLEWVDGGYDPEQFNLRATNELLDLYDRQTRRRRPD